MRCPCAMIPVNPNELICPVMRLKRWVSIFVTSVGVVKRFVAWDERWGFSLLRFTFRLSIVKCRATSISEISPNPAAAASACPICPFIDVHCTWSAREHRTLAAAPISIGSPRVVPVPCASRDRSLITSSAVAHKTVCRRNYYAFPLGALRLALLPSLRTLDPASRGRPLLVRDNLTAWQPSAR